MADSNGRFVAIKGHTSPTVSIFSANLLLSKRVTIWPQKPQTGAASPAQMLAKVETHRLRQSSLQTCCCQREWPWLQKPQTGAASPAQCPWPVAPKGTVCWLPARLELCCAAKSRWAGVHVPVECEEGAWWFRIDVCVCVCTRWSVYPY